MFIGNSIYNIVNLIIFLLPIFIFKLPGVAERLLHKTYSQLSYKLIIYKDSVKCAYIRNNRIPKFKVQDIQFFKRIIGAQYYLFIDTILGFVFAIVILYNRDLILSCLNNINDYAGKTIAQVNFQTNIPFGLRPDHYVFKFLAQPNYFFLLSLSQVFYLIKPYHIYFIYTIIFSSILGFSIGISLIIDFFSLIWYPFKCVYIMTYTMTLELMTIIKHLWRICKGQRFNPNDDRIEEYNYDDLSRVLCVPIV